MLCQRPQQTLGFFLYLKTAPSLGYTHLHSLKNKFQRNPHFFRVNILIRNFNCEYPQVVHIVIHLYTRSVRNLVSIYVLDTK